MKKATCLVIGLSLIGGAIYSLSDASRMQYHQQIRERAKMKENSRIQPRGTHRSRSLLKGRRTVSNAGFQRSRRTRTDVRFGQDQKNNERIGTYANNEFSLQMPIGVREDNPEKAIYLSRSNNFEVKIKALPNTACKDTAQSLGVCLMQLSNNENLETTERPYPISITSKVRRATSKRDIYLNQSTIEEVFEESFIGTTQKGDKKYYARLFIPTRNGTVYVIETSVPLIQAQKYIGTSKRVFDSFRVKQELPVVISEEIQ